MQTSGVNHFISRLKNIAPIYFVEGNYELTNLASREEITKILLDNLVSVLQNESVNVTFGAAEITIIGLGDNQHYDKKYIEQNENAKTNCKILLAHRPEKWDNYVNQDKQNCPNLILTGTHTEGSFGFLAKVWLRPIKDFFQNLIAVVIKLTTKAVR